MNLKQTSPCIASAPLWALCSLAMALPACGGVDPAVHQRLAEDHARLVKRVEAIEAHIHPPHIKAQKKPRERPRHPMLPQARTEQERPCTSWILRSEIEALPKGLGQVDYDPRCVVTPTAYAIKQAQPHVLGAVFDGRRALNAMKREDRQERLRRYPREEGVDPAWTKQAEAQLEGIVQRAQAQTKRQKRRAAAPKVNATHTIDCGKTLCVVIARCEGDRSVCETITAMIESGVTRAGFDDGSAFGEAASSLGARGSMVRFVTIVPRKHFKVPEALKALRW